MSAADTALYLSKAHGRDRYTIFSPGTGLPLSPAGLVGREIPLESRILHAADALDSVTRARAYRRDRPLREAMAELSYGAGTRLDPIIATRLTALVESGRLRVPGRGEAPAPGRSVMR